MLDQAKKLISGFFGAPRSQGGVTTDVQAATTMAPLPVPKVKGGNQATPSFVKRTAQQKGDQRLQENDRRVASTDILSFRTASTTKEVVRQLAATSPDLSASVYAYNRLVVTRKFSAVARNQDGTANPEATASVQMLLSRLNFLTDYSQGFSGVTSIHALAEQLTKELRQYGSASYELVLDKSRMPSRMQPISTTQIRFVDDGSGTVRPEQQINGQYINLDIPTFFYASMDQDLLEAYSSSPLEAGVQAVIADTEFTNDVRRVIKRALHPRLTAKIGMEDFKRTVPSEYMGDAEKTRDFQNQFITGISDAVNGLDPEDALVHFDNVTFDYLNNGNASLSNEYKVLQDHSNSKMAAGSKTPPAVLGHGAGSQNIASTETLLFLRYCESMQQTINSLISRGLTLGLRLMGHDVYCEFSFDRVDIRPDAELEAFRTMKQSRVLEQLSLGMITDEEASIELFGRLPPAGAPKLSGTMFHKASAANPNPHSNTAQDANGQANNPDTPTQSKGPAQQNVKRVK